MHPQHTWLTERISIDWDRERWKRDDNQKRIKHTCQCHAAELHGSNFHPNIPWRSAVTFLPFSFGDPDSLLYILCPPWQLEYMLLHLGTSWTDLTKLLLSTIQNNMYQNTTYIHATEYFTNTFKNTYRPCYLKGNLKCMLLSGLSLDYNKYLWSPKPSLTLLWPSLALFPIWVPKHSPKLHNFKNKKTNFMCIY